MQKSFKVGDPLPTTDEQAIEYLPDYPAAHTLYRCYRGMGRNIVDALTKTLEAVCGIKTTEGK